MGILLIGWYSQQTGAGYGLAQLGYGIGAFGKGIGEFVGGMLSPKITPVVYPTIGINLCIPFVHECTVPSGISGGYNLKQGTYESMPYTNSAVVPKQFMPSKNMPF